MSKIGKITSADKVPNWTRNKKLYQAESEAIMKLKIGEAIPIEFDTEEQALAARNTIRDALNKEFRFAMMRGETPPMEGMITTRVEQGTSVAWFTMQPAESVLGQEAMEQRESTSRNRNTPKSGSRRK